MLGKLGISDIPYHEPLVMSAVAGMILVTIAILALFTYFRKWRYLWREWLTSVDHKRIGIMYVILSLVMLLRGLSDAVMMRSQQALAAGLSHGYLEPDHFNQVFTAHGTIMIIFVAMPFMVGLMNLILPQQIGARDVAYPYLNSLSLWLTAAGATLVLVSLAVGEFSKAGWSGYAPLSEKTFSPGVGVDYWLWSIQIAGVGSLLSSINFLVTIFKMRAPGMTLMRMPVFVWTTLCTTVLMLLSFPVLTVTLSLLTLDRYLGMHFFTNAMGGDMMMYINLFWIWGHPEVYIVVLPAFGIFSEVAATFSSKRLFGYSSMVWAIIAIMFLSFAVWLHHFFTMGAGPDVNTFFGITTMIIAVPTGVKVFNWLFTMYRGRVRFSTPMLWTVGFITTFTVGGMAGVLLASPPADYVLHNSLFLVAHFHTMLVTGALFGYFAGYSYWFPKAFGFTLNEKWGIAAFVCWLSGFYLAFVPLYALGFAGMPRRMAHYDNLAWHPYLIVAAVGTAIIMIGVGCQAIQLIVSIRNRSTLKDATGDPWDGRTLEWATASPPAEYNFATVPVVSDIDAFAQMKENGTFPEQHEDYQDIHMPRNTAVGFIQGVSAFLFGFAMIWYIWWLAAASLLAIVAAMIRRSFDDDTEFTIPAEEIKHNEEMRRRELAAVMKRTKGVIAPQSLAQA